MVLWAALWYLGHHFGMLDTTLVMVFWAALWYVGHHFGHGILETTLEVVSAKHSVLFFAQMYFIC